MKSKKGFEFSGMLVYIILIILVSILVLVLIYNNFASFREKAEKVSPEHIVKLDQESFTEGREVDFVFKKSTGSSRYN